MGVLFWIASIGFGLKFYALARWRAELLMQRAIDEQGASAPREAFAYVRTHGGTNGAAVFAACFIVAAAAVVLVSLGV